MRTTLVTTITGLVLATGGVLLASPLTYSHSIALNSFSSLSGSSNVTILAQVGGYTVSFFNACSSTPVEVAVNFQNSSNESETKGWYKLAPGQQIRLNGVETRNRTFNYYARTTNGDKTVWEGNILIPVGPGDIRTGPMIQVNMGPTPRNFTQTITCPGQTPLIPPETSSEVVGERYEDMGGGWGGAKATLYRNGLLSIEGRAVSNANNSGTRTTVNVVGVDRDGNALFISEHLDIPTACGRWDTCPSDRRGRSDQKISPEIAKYVSRLNIHMSDRQGPSVYQNFTRNIREACASYDELPVAARAAIAYKTSFPGCNPGK